MDGSIRMVSVCDYVAQLFDTVKAFLARPDVSELVNAGLDLPVRLRPVEAIGRAVAQAPVAWAVEDAAGATGRITLLVVNSGREALTEVLVSAWTGEKAAGRIATAARALLDRVSTLLEPPAAHTGEVTISPAA